MLNHSMKSLHTKDVEEVLSYYKTSSNGLEDFEAKKRLKIYGPNRLIEKRRRAALKILLEQFKSVLVILLLIATIVSILVSDYLEASVIAIILVLNAFLGFNQEYRAERTIESLKKYLIPKVQVVRNNQIQLISSEELVPGDITILENGERVPADLRIIDSSDLRIDESALTGESYPVEKISNRIEDVILPERKNMAYMGTLVTYGKSRGVVTGTGMMTEIGKIAESISETEEPTPLQNKMNRFGKNIGILIIIISSIIFAVGFLKNIADPNMTETTTDLLLTSIALAVAAVPEGLPAIIALTLSIGTVRFAKRNAVVKRLAAAEAFGPVDIIAADKTGTMTTNEMTVRRIYFNNTSVNVTGHGFNPDGDLLIQDKKVDARKIIGLQRLILSCNNCNNAILKKNSGYSIIGDPTEGALKVLAQKSGVKEEYPELQEISFSSERKMMTTINKVDDSIKAFSKGAPEEIISFCTHESGKKFTESRRKEVMKEADNLASQGFRVIAVADRILGDKFELKDVEREMDFLGLVGIIDPPRKETRDALKLCKDAGIRTIMITGDHKLTAKAVAEEIGLKGEVMTGTELDSISDEELEDRLSKNTSIFGRVSPEHKLRIVKLLRKQGLIVAVTGDGVNDAPALRAADIGVSMGIKGTSVAKEASDVILLDDNFSTIVSAIEEGRVISDNIMKYIKFLFSANFGEVAIIALGILFGFPLPLLVLQILWVNLATDGLPALALSVDPKDKDLMKGKRKQVRNILREYKYFFTVSSTVLTSVSFYTFIQEQPTIDEGHLIKARTMTLTVVVLYGLLLAFNCRSDKRSVFRMNPFSNKWLILAIASSILLHISIIYHPSLQAVFQTVPLSPSDWIKAILFSVPSLFMLPEILIRKK